MRLTKSRTVLLWTYPSHTARNTFLHRHRTSAPLRQTNRRGRGASMSMPPVHGDPVLAETQQVYTDWAGWGEASSVSIAGMPSAPPGNTLLAVKTVFSACLMAMGETVPEMRGYLVRLFKGFPMVCRLTCECNAVTLCGLLRHLFTTCSLVQYALHVHRPARWFLKQPPLFQVHLLCYQSVGLAHGRCAHQARDMRVGSF